LTIQSNSSVSQGLKSIFCSLRRVRALIVAPLSHPNLVPCRFRLSKNSDRDQLNSLDGHSFHISDFQGDIHLTPLQKHISDIEMNNLKVRSVSRSHRKVAPLAAPWGNPVGHPMGCPTVCPSGAERAYQWVLM
jgi:hypothetical protein